MMLGKIVLSFLSKVLEFEFFTLVGLYPTFVISQGYSADTGVYLVVVLNVYVPVRSNFSSTHILIKS